MYPSEMARERLIVCVTEYGTQVTGQGQIDTRQNSMPSRRLGFTIQVAQRPDLSLKGWLVTNPKIVQYMVTIYNVVIK
jgi:hypothetical protein